MCKVLTISCGQTRVHLSVLADDKNLSYTSDAGSFQHFFEKTNDGSLVARNLSVDLEPNVFDDIRNGAIENLFHVELLLNGKEDAGNNFARDHYTVGEQIIGKVNSRMTSMRKFVDNCDNAQRFGVNH